MRSENYVTMFDPFQLKYGKKVGAILFIPQILGDLFWTAAVLAALGATISIILSLDATVSIVVSSAVAVIYTVFGGLYSVAYTDVLQLIFIAVGLIIAFPFSLSHPAVDLSTIQNSWLGTVPTSSIASYIDTLLLCVLGGLPWQSNEGLEQLQSYAPCYRYTGLYGKSGKRRNIPDGNQLKSA
ncbi:high-affinity choline transporter 1 [Biomphalaria glabrata]|nr:high-affinity choline transporter 1 [Biomphalaria glabrata]